MTRGEGACLICGKPLQYFDQMREMECAICHKTFQSNACCEDGHFVCDDCHEKRGVEVILEGCLAAKDRDPVKLMQRLMEDPYIYMHGPEHHIMVGAALLTAYHNCGGELDLPAALQEMKARGQACPGGTCGFWGCCGAAVSTGMFVSIITKATPLSGKEWGYANEMTARALQKIASFGGPRCCKRNSFTAAAEAVQYVKERFGIEMELPERILCDFSGENQQCLRKRCPYHPINAEQA